MPGPPPLSNTALLSATRTRMGATGIRTRGSSGDLRWFHPHTRSEAGGMSTFRKAAGSRQHREAAGPSLSVSALKGLYHHSTDSSTKASPCFGITLTRTRRETIDAAEESKDAPKWTRVRAAGWKESCQGVSTQSDGASAPARPSGSHRTGHAYPNSQVSRALKGPNHLGTAKLSAQPSWFDHLLQSRLVKTVRGRLRTGVGARARARASELG